MTSVFGLPCKDKWCFWCYSAWNIYKYSKLWILLTLLLSEIKVFFFKYCLKMKFLITFWVEVIVFTFLIIKIYYIIHLFISIYMHSYNTLFLYTQFQTLWLALDRIQQTLKKSNNFNKTYSFLWVTTCKQIHFNKHNNRITYMIHSWK